MASAREMRLRMGSVKNIAQVTKALETVSASKVRRAVQLYTATRPYAEKAWKLLLHLARQPGGHELHALLTERAKVNRVLVIMMSSDRGLAGAYNVNILRHTLQYFGDFDQPVSFVAVGRKGRDMLYRRHLAVAADFSDIPAAPSFADISSIGRLAVDDFLNHKFDEVWVSYTEFQTMMRQEPMIRRILPLEIDYGGNGFNAVHHKTSSVFTYEPDESGILDEIIPRFTALQVYRSILSAQASEHAARMVAMRNATDNALDLLDELRLDYNKARQQSITSDMLDIVGGAEALTRAAA